MSKIQVYTVNRKSPESMDFPKDKFVEPNTSLISQAMFVFEDRSHKGSSKVKTRSEVNATTAKIYKQKGTGNARHGSRRAPIFKGGGIAHGPKGVKRLLSLSKKMNRKAINMALSTKVADGTAKAVDKLEGLTKTKEAQELLNTIFGKEMKNKESKIILALADGKNEWVRAFGNIKNVIVKSFKGLNIKDIVDSRALLIDKKALEDKGTTPLRKDFEGQASTKSIKVIKKENISAKTPRKTKMKNEKTIKSKTRKGGKVVVK